MLSNEHVALLRVSSRRRPSAPPTVRSKLSLRPSALSLRDFISADSSLRSSSSATVHSSLSPAHPLRGSASNLLSLASASAATPFISSSFHCCGTTSA
ncbi:hypothetical protein RIF29_28173 [Crotalaria pallida]|uniref:Uncharacterized protein n=1 Tax=Crotalaria pallida TaxID=3830 RepID=A0AAN9I346_CROPI